ncbi:hypothetical protein C4572_04060 [Candidatus Parcubacteria bacterium]|nr:MAG: hypothetical protein C4572_04060 [Candidatus Parcubacteria bacterium]
MYWANFLHIYQPVVQKDIWVKRVADESYRKIFRGLLDIDRAKITLNISGVLCDLLEKNGCSDVLESIKNLIDAGKLEITGSAKYHAFLPLLPESEIERQIVLNEETLDKYFGKNWKKGGFFPPEMAYSKKVAEVAKRLGYKWMIVDEMAFPPGKKIEKDVIYEIKGIKDFHVFFRERNLTFKILSGSRVSSLPAIMKFLEKRIGNSEYSVTAMDGETFGHHRPGLENLMFDLLREESIKPATITELLDIFPKKEIIEPRPSTWAAVPRDFEVGEPYFRWKSSGNQIQQWQWELLELAAEIVSRNEDEDIRGRLDRALHSDQFWWSSARPWWSLEWIERGAYDLKEIINDSKNASKEEREKAEELYKQIIFTGFDWQRSGKVDELSRSENEEIQERLEEKEKFFITKEEYEEMVKNLNEQIEEAVKHREYHRAAMIKDRIRELKEEMEKGVQEKKSNDLMF